MPASRDWPHGVTRIRYDFDADFYVESETRHGPWVVWDADCRQGARRVKAYADRADALRFTIGFVAARKLGCPDRCPECGHKKNSSNCQGSHA